jgi:hypothetical protein
MDLFEFFLAVLRGLLFIVASGFCAVCVVENERRWRPSSYAIKVGCAGLSLLLAYLAIEAFVNIYISRIGA